MTVRRGDIVLMDFPFSGGAGSKVRPALVVQADRNNERLHTTIVAMITRTTERAASEPTQLLLEVSTLAGRASGLLHTSALKCENVFTVEQQAILRVLGRLPDATMAQVDACLRSSFGLF